MRGDRSVETYSSGDSPGIRRTERERPSGIAGEISFAFFTVTTFLSFGDTKGSFPIMEFIIM